MSRTSRTPLTIFQREDSAVRVVEVLVALITTILLMSLIKGGLELFCWRYIARGAIQRQLVGRDQS